MAKKSRNSTNRRSSGSLYTNSIHDDFEEEENMSFRRRDSDSLPLAPDVQMELNFAKEQEINRQSGMLVKLMAPLMRAIQGISTFFWWRKAPLPKFEEPIHMIRHIKGELISGKPMSDYFFPVYANALIADYGDTVERSGPGFSKSGTGFGFIHLSAKNEKSDSFLLQEQLDQVLRQNPKKITQEYVTEYLQNLISEIRDIEDKKILIPINLVGGHKVLIQIDKSPLNDSITAIRYYDPKGTDVLVSGADQWVDDHRSDKRLKISVDDLLKGICTAFAFDKKKVQSSKSKHQGFGVKDSAIYVAKAMKTFLSDSEAQSTHRISSQKAFKTINETKRIDVRKERKDMYAEIVEAAGPHKHDMDVREQSAQELVRKKAFIASQMKKHNIWDLDGSGNVVHDETIPSSRRIFKS